MFHPHMRFYVMQWSTVTAYSHPLPSEKIMAAQLKSPFEKSSCLLIKSCCDILLFFISFSHCFKPRCLAPMFHKSGI